MSNVHNPASGLSEDSTTGLPVADKSTGQAKHVTSPAYDTAPIYEAGGYKYIAETFTLGSALSAAVWRITRIRTADTQIAYAGSAGTFGGFNQVATPAGLAALTYSQA